MSSDDVQRDDAQLRSAGRCPAGAQDVEAEVWKIGTMPYTLLLI